MLIRIVIFVLSFFSITLFASIDHVTFQIPFRCLFSIKYLSTCFFEYRAPQRVCRFCELGKRQVLFSAPAIFFRRMCCFSLEKEAVS